MTHHPPKKTSLLAVAPFLILPPLFWAGNFAVGRAIREDIPPFTLSFGRWMIALIILLPFVLHYMRRDWHLYHENMGKIIAVSIVGVSAFNTLVYKGLHSTTTTNAILLNSCIPVLIMLIGACFYQQKLRLLQIGGLIISLLGVLTIVLHGDWSRLISLSFNPGDLTVFTAMICWALYTLWMKDIPPQIDRRGLMGLQIIIAVIALAPLFLWEMQYSSLHFNQSALLALAYVGIFPSVIAYLLYTIAVQKVGAVHAGLSIHLMPVFGVLISVLILGENFHLYHAIGIAAIAVGLYLSNKSA